MPPQNLIDNIARVHEAVAAACARVHRDPGEVQVIAVSKQKPAGAIVEAAVAGLQHFGESRVEEAQDKIPQVAGDSALSPGQRLTWHMIGHVQSRKARMIPLLFDVVHSVDSTRLAERLAQAATARPDRQALQVFIQVNISGEEAKSGLPALGWERDMALREALSAEISAIAALPGLDVRGLMTIAPLVADPEQARPFFAGLAALREHLAQAVGLHLPELSMGMTSDYTIAVEEGATQVRIGRAIFGERAS